MQNRALASHSLGLGPALVAVALVLPWLVACGEIAPERSHIQSGQALSPHPKEQSIELLSEPFGLERIYRSMLGPVFVRPTRLIAEDPPELVWLTGYSVDIVDANGKTPTSIEYECHSNLGWSKETPAGFHRPSERAFTLTQGQTDLRLPPGFGLPVLSSESINVYSQLLNLRQEDLAKRVRHRLNVRFVRDRDLEKPFTPLAVTHAFAMVSLESEDLVYNVAAPSEQIEGATCSVGQLPPQIRGAYKDKAGRRFAGHWLVEPGEHEWHTLATEQIRIPYDTTIHFIGVHVHPYSESLELRDLTTGESIWKSYQKQPSERVGLEWIDYFASEQGVPIYKDHQYEIVSRYHNPTRQRMDAMATMFIYYKDLQFESPLATPTRDARAMAAPAGAGS